jgi:pentatricopeptide repeat protein
MDVGVKPDIIAFTTRIDGYCLVGKKENAFWVIDAMVLFGIEPNVTNSTLNGLTLLREMMLNRVKSATDTHGIILNVLTSCWENCCR